MTHRSGIWNQETLALQQLHRSWAIETSIIEGIYRPDEAQTQILIEQGFEDPAIPPCGTGQDADNLLAILQDRMTALDAMYSEVSRGHSISQSAIRWAARRAWRGVT